MKDYQIRCNTNYVKKAYSRVPIQFNLDKDGKLVKWLECQENITQYVLNLVRNSDEYQEYLQRK